MQTGLVISLSLVILVISAQEDSRPSVWRNSLIPVLECNSSVHNFNVRLESWNQPSRNWYCLNTELNTGKNCYLPAGSVKTFCQGEILNFRLENCVFSGIFDFQSPARGCRESQLLLGQYCSDLYCSKFRSELYPLPQSSNWQYGYNVAHRVSGGLSKLLGPSCSTSSHYRRAPAVRLRLWLLVQRISLMGCPPWYSPLWFVLLPV